MSLLKGKRKFDQLQEAQGTAYAKVCRIREARKLAKEISVHAKGLQGEIILLWKRVQVRESIQASLQERIQHLLAPGSTGMTLEEKELEIASSSMDLKEVKKSMAQDKEQIRANCSELDALFRRNLLAEFHLEEDEDCGIVMQKRVAREISLLTVELQRLHQLARDWASFHTPTVVNEVDGYCDSSMSAFDVPCCDSYSTPARHVMRISESSNVSMADGSPPLVDVDSDSEAENSGGPTWEMGEGDEKEEEEEQGIKNEGRGEWTLLLRKVEKLQRENGRLQQELEDRQAVLKYLGQTEEQLGAAVSAEATLKQAQLENFISILREQQLATESVGARLATKVSHAKPDPTAQKNSHRDPNKAQADPILLSTFPQGDQPTHLHKENCTFSSGGGGKERGKGGEESPTGPLGKALCPSESMYEGTTPSEHGSECSAVSETSECVIPTAVKHLDSGTAPLISPGKSSCVVLHGAFLDESGVRGECGMVASLVKEGRESVVQAGAKVWKAGGEEGLGLGSWKWLGDGGRASGILVDVGIQTDAEVAGDADVGVQTDAEVAGDVDVGVQTDAEVAGDVDVGVQTDADLSLDMADGGVVSDGEEWALSFPRDSGAPGAVALEAAEAAVQDERQARLEAERRAAELAIHLAALQQQICQMSRGGWVETFRQLADERAAELAQEQGWSADAETRVETTSDELATLQASATPPQDCGGDEEGVVEEGETERDMEKVETMDLRCQLSEAQDATRNLQRELDAERAAREEAESRAESITRQAEDLCNQVRQLKRCMQETIANNGKERVSDSQSGRPEDGARPRCSEGPILFCKEEVKVMERVFESFKREKHSMRGKIDSLVIQNRVLELSAISSHPKASIRHRVMSFLSGMVMMCMFIWFVSGCASRIMKLNGFVDGGLRPT